MLLEINISLRRSNFNLSTELSIQDESIGLIGRSGAGKSTLLGLLAGTLTPETGRITLDGKILFDSHKGIFVPREQRPIGAVLQNDRLVQHETVKDSLSDAYVRTLKQRRRLKPARLVDFLGLGHLLGQSMAHLSAGEYQRVLLAKALLKSPTLLLLDDFLVTVGQANSIAPLLKYMQTELQLPLVYASHTLGDITEFSDKIGVVDGGRLVRIGFVNELLRETSLVQKIGLSQTANKMSATILAHDTNNRCTLAESYGIELVLPLRQDIPVGSVVTIAIPSNEIALSRHYLSGISIQNQIKGRICALIPSEQGILAQIDCGTVWLVGITLKACRDMRLQEGDDVYCLAKTQAFSCWTHTAPELLDKLFEHKKRRN